MINFTKGNWDIDTGSFGENIIVSHDDDYNEIPIAHFDSVSQCTFNAVLCACAPDMYNLLHKILTEKKCRSADIQAILDKMDNMLSLWKDSFSNVQFEDNSDNAQKEKSND